MIDKVAVKVVEAGVKTAEKAAEVTAQEAGREIAKGVGKGVDVAKRVDVTNMGVGTDSIGVDISKRIKPEGNEKGIPKELSAKQSDDLIKKGMSPDCVKKCEFQDGIYKLKTQNEKLDKSVHPESGVPYRKKVVDLFGTKIEGVFPKFDAVYKTKLPDELFLASDTKQFDYCISQLQKEISKNPELKEKFTERELLQIADGKTPSRFIWNHHEEPGKMELVDAKTHSTSGHTGGKAIWGGGQDFR